MSMHANINIGEAELVNMQSQPKIYGILRQQGPIAVLLIAYSSPPSSSCCSSSLCSSSQRPASQA
jgi:hypothetical protein